MINKKKVTIYLNEEIYNKLKEIYITEMRLCRKPTYSRIISDGIEVSYDHLMDEIEKCNVLNSKST